MTDKSFPTGLGQQEQSGFEGFTTEELEAYCDELVRELRRRNLDSCDHSGAIMPVDLEVA